MSEGNILSLEKIRNEVNIYSIPNKSGKNSAFRSAVIGYNYRLLVVIRRWQITPAQIWMYFHRTFFQTYL